VSLSCKGRLRPARMMKITAVIGGLVAASIACLLLLRLSGPGPGEPFWQRADTSPSGPTGITSAAAGLSGRDRPAEPAANSPLAAWEAESDPERRTEVLDRIVQSADSDTSKLLDSLLTRVDPAAAELRQLLVRRWAEEHPQAAAAWAALLAEGPMQSEVVSQIAIAWANIDLTAAADWVSSLPDSAAKQQALANLAYEACRSTPETALALAESLPPNAERGTLVVYAVSQWAAADPTAATAWAENVADANLRQRLVAAVAVALAKQDGAAAARLAASAIAPGEEQDRAVVAIVQRWAQTAPRDALSWIRQFPNPSLRQAALQSIVALETPLTGTGP
jgi:hypothetical protein